MKDHPDHAMPALGNKFRHRHVTAKGETRATVPLRDPKTLWFNTGTLCNIACANCYIESSPVNDRLAYLSPAEVEDYLRQLEARRWGVSEIGFTGGEPFMNPGMIDMAEASLARGYEVLILTNAMQPMMRPRVQEGLRRLNAAHPGRMTLRVSLDHYGEAQHDAERGAGSYARTLDGMDWLRDAGIAMTVAGRTIWGETEAAAREGFARLFATRHYAIDAADPAACVLFPEMDETVDVPEITTACWDILGKSPDSVMCASSRMVVKRRGAARPAVLACTLLPYDPQFELGETLEEAEADVALNHPHCAKFCVLGGASCSG
ncbi:radical SAM protein [Poseidonocella sp. HB161398]|uniref:radical SAM protein n=1 Tax=Poseidonocella sp. HB161398 TaxID=2320855 RepID=UPI0011098A46|nr:radical SAM protein [Poseidonocella sp. HB161398]